FVEISTDGWGTGLNLSTNLQGLLPLDCLSGFDGSVQKDEKGKKKNKQRMSSIYGDSVYGTDSVYQSNNDSAPSKSQIAVYDFTPSANDEVELRVGDMVELETSYDDGWAFGKNVTTGQSGLFPLDCLPGAEVKVDEKGQKKNKQRTSSIYGTAGNNNLESLYGAESVYGNGAGPAAPSSASTGTQVAVYDYVPTQSDELKVTVGDKIQVITAYDDGWAVGKNLSTKKEGLFPLDCLPVAKSGGGAGGQKSQQRVSSLYGGNTDSYYDYGGGANGKY
ncbi:hypothetical protein CcCBS67573_g10181, partial [Chytriomyces confervae]